MNREPLKIEKLLQTMGTHEIPSDPAHRYELRRKLLCSRFFEVECARHSRWNRLLTYTAPLVAGGMMVGVFSLFAVSVSESGVESTVVSTGVHVIDTREEPQPTLNAFISDPSELVVQLADIDTNSEEIHFVPISEHTLVLTQ